MATVWLLHGLGWLWLIVDSSKRSMAAPASSLLAPLTMNRPLPSPVDALWHAMQPYLVEAASPASYQTWLSSLQPKHWDELKATLTLSIDSRFKKDWVTKHYQAILNGALAKHLADDDMMTVDPAVNRPFVAIVVSDVEVAQPSLLTAMMPSSANAVELSTPSSPLAAHGQLPAFGNQPSHQTLHPQLRSLAYNSKALNPHYRWEQLIVGQHNQFAVSAGQAVASQPGQQFNPLCLHGGTGLGKTHLMQAMAHQMEEAGLTVCYVTAEQFTNELIAAVSKKQWQPFRNRYRQVDVLLIDDVQFLGGKERTQQEFFHTLNTLVEGGKQVVLSADRPPATLDMLDERLRSRFEMGLLVEVLAPDELTRCQILRAKARQAQLVLDDDIIEWLAHRFTTHVRQLEGAINTLRAMVTLAKMVPSLHAVEQQFGVASQRSRPRRAINPRGDDGSVGENHANPAYNLPAIVDAHQYPPSSSGTNSLTMIIESVAHHFGVSVPQLCGQQRSRQVAQARQAACYIMRQLTPASFADIGRAIGGRQHSTVVHAAKKVTAQMGDPSSGLVKQINQVLAELQHECLL